MSAQLTADRRKSPFQRGKRAVQYGNAQSGWIAWALHRITGLLLLGYLVTHLTVLSSIGSGRASFDGVMMQFNQPVFKILELGLLWCALYHALNGIRLVLLDLPWSLRLKQKLMFASAMALALFVVLVSIPIFLEG